MADWPVYDESLIDEQLNHEMNLVVDLASLGHAARNKENLKVRQRWRNVRFLWVWLKIGRLSKSMLTFWKKN
jgi:isoleucyl-tRNA synthetase